MYRLLAGRKEERPVPRFRDRAPQGWAVLRMPGGLHEHLIQQLADRAIGLDDRAAMIHVA